MICAFIGPAKTRTSSVYEAALKLYPENCYSGIKESYFHSLEKSYKTYYKSILPKRTILKSHHDEIRKMISSNLDPFFIFEPSYALSAITNLSRIKDIMCVLTIRDPVKRLISHYNMDIALGLSSTDFNTELEDDCKYEQYVKNSKYYDLIQQWLEKKPGQLVIGDFEERKLYFTKNIKNHDEILLKIRNILRKSTEIKTNEAFVFKFKFIRSILKNEMYKKYNIYIPRIFKKILKTKNNNIKKDIPSKIIRIIEQDYSKYKKTVSASYKSISFR